MMVRLQIGKKAVLNVRDAVARMAGDERLYRSLIAQFREDCPGLLRSLVDALDRSRTDEAKRIAYRLKSTALTLGAEELAAAADQVHQILFDGCLDQLSMARREVVDAIRRLTERLHESDDGE